MELYIIRHGETDWNIEKRLQGRSDTELNAYGIELAEITAEALKEAGIISKICDGIVILGRGELDKKLTVKAKRFSKTAAEKIEAAGGKAEVV